LEGGRRRRGCEPAFSSTLTGEGFFSRIKIRMMGETRKGRGSQGIIMIWAEVRRLFPLKKKEERKIYIGVNRWKGSQREVGK